ncbi:MAG: putative toxin-antitoxin system toxin component, PIN family [Betaproteobacteria bacterium]|nr:MAG: putative toxin-antitoxin system toxin component, PIN family [Betaproteobacteria bacterium]
MAPAKRLVIDTNVLVSALVFRDSRHLPLRAAWQAGRVTPLLSISTYRELKKVLCYPMFKLDDEQINAGIAHLGPFIEWVTIDRERIEALPKCSDRDDQKFLNVALCGNADALLSYDRALLKLRKRNLPFSIISPESLEFDQ